MTEALTGRDTARQSKSGRNRMRKESFIALRRVVNLPVQSSWTGQNPGRFPLREQGFLPAAIRLFCGRLEPFRTAKDSPRHLRLELRGMARQFFPGRPPTRALAGILCALFPGGRN